MDGELRLRGIITALVTPFSGSGDLDEGALADIVQFQVRSGVNGLFPLGTTGMGPAMEPDERKRVAEIVTDSVDGRIPVIVQVGDSNPKVSLELARHAENVGADAVASLNPFYYHPGPETVVEHYRRLAEATKLPLLAYNIPRNTGNNIDAQLLRQLSQIPHLIGIKDSSRDFSQLLDYLASVPKGFTVINGTDSYLFSAYCAGVSAGVSATANAVPELFVRMYDAYLSNDLKSGQELQKKIHAVRDATSSPALAPLLEALKFRGIKSGNVRPPLRPMSPKEVADLRITFGRLMPDLKIAA
ncbi:MAG TPA: dihydrodipicolinate synthase family protein [Candidatus Dormibacteraeota bacterium]|nr:dihydrodipicolinate synthase family protein [Candidatus Dormibacteraeota bacterium]